MSDIKMSMDQPLSIQVKVVDVESLDIPEIKALYRACKWDWLEPDTEMFSAFQNSWRIFVATSEDKVVGFSRIVSDGKIYGLLTDFIIAPEHRRKGYGDKNSREWLPTSADRKCDLALSD